MLKTSVYIINKLVQMLASAISIYKRSKGVTLAMRLRTAVVSCYRGLASQKLFRKRKQVPGSSKEKEGSPGDYAPFTVPTAVTSLLSWDTLRRTLNVEQLSDGLRLSRLLRFSITSPGFLVVE